MSAIIRSGTPYEVLFYRALPDFHGKSGSIGVHQVPFFVCHRAYVPPSLNAVEQQQDALNYLIESPDCVLLKYPDSNK